MDYVIARPWKDPEDGLCIYTYGSEIQRGDLSDAKRLLDYVRRQKDETGSKNYAIYEVTFNEVVNKVAPTTKKAAASKESKLIRKAALFGPTPPYTGNTHVWFGKAFGAGSHPLGRLCDEFLCGGFGSSDEIVCRTFFLFVAEAL